VAVQPDGKVILAGAFTSINGTSRNYLARLNSGGSVDAGFLNNLSGPNGQVYCVALQTNGQILIGGAFTNVNGIGRSRVARLNSDGSLDNGFLNGLAGATDWVQSIAIQPDGKILIGGYFSMVNGQTRNLVARLNADGSLDGTFLNGMAGVNNAVFSIVPQPDNKILIAGAFTVVNGLTRNSIARLNSDGSVDVTFQNGLSGANAEINAIALQPDGRIIAVGAFTLFNGTPRFRVTRLNPDGALDNTFMNGDSGANGFVYSVSLQPDGKILIGGDFGSINDIDRNGVARLQPDGTVDEWFLFGLGGANDRVGSLAMQPDGKIVVGGDFTFVNGIARTQVARLLVNYGAPQIIAPQKPLQQFFFYLIGTPGDTLMVQGSTNLQNWVDIESKFLGTTPPGFSDPQTPFIPHRFYRLRKL
jgi:uncharacterized delta-60 repeat protein